MIKKILLPLIAIFFLTSCYHYAPFTHRKQLILVSPQEEKQLGYKAEQEILQKASINHNPTLNAMVKRVGWRIAKAANRPDYRWSFHVINDNSINAFCLPGGKIFVNTGLFKIVKSDEDLAVVLSHEVGHAIARHVAERMSMSEVSNLAKSLLLKESKNKYLKEAFDIGQTYGLMMPFSRKYEYEADEIGLILMAKAGYDPRHAINFWQRMIEASKGGNIPEFLSTHPSDIKRLNRIKRLIPKALKYYRK